MTEATKEWAAFESTLSSQGVKHQLKSGDRKYASRRGQYDWAERERGWMAADGITYETCRNGLIRRTRELLVALEEKDFYVRRDISATPLRVKYVRAYREQGRPLPNALMSPTGEQANTDKAKRTLRKNLRAVVVNGQTIEVADAPSVIEEGGKRLRYARYLRRTNIERARLGLPELDVREVVRLYVEERKSVRIVAEVCRCNRSQVERLLELAGVPMRSRAESALVRWSEVPANRSAKYRPLVLYYDLVRGLMAKNMLSEEIADEMMKEYPDLKTRGKRLVRILAWRVMRRLDNEDNDEGEDAPPPSSHELKRLVNQGKSERQIARAMGLSRARVRTGLKWFGLMELEQKDVNKGDEDNPLPPAPGRTRRNRPGAGRPRHTEEQREQAEHNRRVNAAVRQWDEWQECEEWR